MTIKAEEAGKALLVIAAKLLDKGIVVPEGFAVLQRIGERLKREKSAQSWNIEVDPGEPVTFKKVKDKSGLVVAPSIIANIAIVQNDRNTPPFSRLDMALQINDEQGQPVCRWHLDLANQQDGKWQSGPLVHLQYGGHFQNAGHLDIPFKTPRWCHPPMEVALLCEVVAANFYESDWQEMRNDMNWCSSIHLYQKLCFTNYLQKMSGCLSVSSSTALNTMWAGAWQ